MLYVCNTHIVHVLLHFCPQVHFILYLKARTFRFQISDFKLSNIPGFWNTVSDRVDSYRVSLYIQKPPLPFCFMPHAGIIAVVASWTTMRFSICHTLSYIVIISACSARSCPVVSLSYLPRAASSLFPCGGLIAGSLEGGCFWEQVDGTTYRQHILPLESGGCTDIQVEPESRHCLVTYRPGEPLKSSFTEGPWNMDLFKPIMKSTLCFEP